MKSFFLYLVTGLLTLFILLSFAAVAADVSILPTLAIAGSLLLFFLAPPLLLFRPKWGASAALLGVGLVLVWLLGFFLSTLSDYIVAGLTDDAALPMLAPLLLLALVGLSGFSAYRILFKREDIHWNSGLPGLHWGGKWALGLIPLLILLLRFWTNLAPPAHPLAKYQAPPEKPPLADRGNRPNLVIAVAPLLNL
jgi:hypothetical protein